MDCSPWGHKESGTTERLTLTMSPILAGRFLPTSATWEARSTCYQDIILQPIFLSTVNFVVANFRHCMIIPLETAMAPRSSTLAWRVPWTEEPCGLQSMGSLRVGHD